MKKITTTLVCAILLMSSFAFAQKTKTKAPQKTTFVASLAGDAADVKAFGMSIIQAYFNHDCDFTFDRLHTSITSFEGGQTIQITPELRKVFCADEPLRTDIPVTFQMYQENYKQEVLNIKEVTTKYPEWVSHLNMQKGDYFFFGSQVKAAGAKRVFRASDAARFLVRKINGEWKIIAM